MKMRLLSPIWRHNADALLRTPNSTPSTEDEIAEQEIEFYAKDIVQNIPASQSLLDEIKHETINNSALSKLKDFLQNEWP